MSRLSVVPYEVRWCDRCKGTRPHSKRGRCMALHRSRRLRYIKPQADLERWHATKTAVFERDGWRCVRCGDSRPLECHHRRIKGDGGVSDEAWEYGLAGLLTLDRACHDWVHTGLGRDPVAAVSHRDEMERLGFIVPRFPGVDPATVPVLTIGGWVLLLDDGSRVAA